MTVTLNSRVNGNTPRKSLSNQLDRLDKILDGLDGALTGAITEAVKDAVSSAVGEAVRATLMEVMTNPDILALVRGAQSPASPPSAEPPSSPPAPRPRAIPRVGQTIAFAWSCFLKKAATVVGAITAPAQNAYRGALGAYKQINAIWRLRRPILVSLAVGAVVGVVVGYAAAPWLAGAISGVGAMSVTMSAQLAVWTRRLFSGLSMI